MFENGTILDNKYQIQAHLGAGGMGEVYRVLDLEQDRECALKILNKMADQKDVRRRFHREFRVLNRFQNPRVVRTFTWGFAEGCPYFTMEYLTGKTLEKIIADRALLGQFRASHLFNLIQQIAEGLAYIHAQGAVHRDLKPSNIIVLETEEGIETTILDMGLAKFRHSHNVSITQAGLAIGTAEYMSPEQGKGLWVDHRSDLYALGVILYEILIGALPFSGQNPISVIMKHIRESPPPMGEVDITAPEEMQQIVLKLLAKEPIDRYQSAAEVMRALHDVAPSGVVLSGDTPADVVRQSVSGDWQWGDFPETLLSDDFSEVLHKRVAALPAVQRRVLEYACVFLNDFSFELLAAIWRGDALELIDVLDDLVEEGLLTTCDEEDGYRFSQGLCRRAIYDHMQNVRRCLLHREIGNALERIEQADELTEELADHFAAAGEQNKAVKYMRLAGKRALEKHAYRQALRRFEAVRERAADDAFESQADAIDFLCDYADVLRNCGQHNSALELLDEAKALLPDDRSDLKARILRLIGGVHGVLQHKEIAEEYMLEALRLYRELGDLDGEIQALGSLAQLCDVSGQHEEAVAYMRRKIEKYAELGGAQNKAIIQGRKGQAALVGFRFETAKAHLEATVKTSQQLGLEHHRIWALNLLPRAYFYLGDLDRAEDVCLEVIGEWQKRGVIHWEAANFLYLGELALERGNFAEALEYAETSSERFLETPRKDYVYRAHAIAATAAARMGDAETALEWAEKAGEGTQQTSGMYTGILPMVWCGIGAALAKAGRINDAEDAFEQAIECRRESKGDHWARALLMAGEFYLERDDKTKARAHLEAAKQAFEEMEMSYFLGKTQALLSQSGESSRGGDAAPTSSSEISVDTLSVDRLHLLYDVSGELTTDLDTNALLDRVLDKLLTVYPVARALVVTKNTSKTSIVVDAVRHHNVEADDAKKISQSIIRRVIETNEPVLSMDAQTDERLNRYQSVIDYHIRSVLCVPLFYKKGVIGALYLDHRGIDNMFDEADQAFLQTLVNLVGVTLVNLCMYKQLQEKAQYLQQKVERRYRLGDLIGQSHAMQEIYQLIESAAKSDIPVLLQGETGTGKELAAHAIHYNSARKNQLFLSQNCAAISPTLLQSELFGHKKGAFTGATENHIGIFETANGGTVFLDEIGDASPELQTCLLRVLQEGEVRRVGETVNRAVDVRIITATNRDLKKEVEKGSFRKDLYYRLHVMQIDMPPLRKYIEDVPLLAKHLLIRAKENVHKSVGELTVGTIKALTRYDWPGNVRELENEIQRAVALVEEGCDITPDLFSETIWQEVSNNTSIQYTGNLSTRVEAYETQVIREVLEKYEGNITHTAKELGMTRSGLQKKIHRLGLR